MSNNFGWWTTNLNVAQRAASDAAHDEDGRVVVVEDTDNPGTYAVAVDPEPSDRFKVRFTA